MQDPTMVAKALLSRATQCITNPLLLLQRQPLAPQGMTQRQRLLTSPLDFISQRVAGVKDTMKRQFATIQRSIAKCHRPRFEWSVIPGNADPRRGAPEPGLAGAQGGGPLGDPSPLALSLYEAANDRPATRLERILLSELEADAAPAAEAAGSSGAEWVAKHCARRWDPVRRSSRPSASGRSLTAGQPPEQDPDDRL